MRGKWTSFFFWFKIVLASLLLILLVGGGVLAAREMRSSDYQARFFADLAQQGELYGR